MKNDIPKCPETNRNMERKNIENFKQKTHSDTKIFSNYNFYTVNRKIIISILIVLTLIISNT